MIFASNKDRRTAGAELHTNFKLSNNADYLALIAPDGSISSEFAPSYPDQFANISYGRSADLLTTGFFTTPTPGTQYDGTDRRSHEADRDQRDHVPSETENDQHEFIELVNRGTQTVNLNGWQFTAGVDYTFGNVTIAPNQFLVIAANVAAFRARYAAVQRQSAAGPAA